MCDRRGPLGAQPRDHQGHSGADVGRFQSDSLEAPAAFDHDPVGVAQRDPGAHADQLVDKEHARLVHPVVDQAQPSAVNRQYDGQADQVGGKKRPQPGCQLGWITLLLAPDAA